MFYSQCLLSRKGPLGGIWVAAYSFKKLKKAHVNQTDISSSVDKILQDEWDVVAYRVLAYLLLGVVRIYSKKVEYLFNDCNEVLIKVKKFVVSTKKDADADPLCAPYYSVTLPDRFELDAFDLGVLEVGDYSGGNVVSHEDITLKDCAKGNGNGEFSSDRYNYEEFGSYDTNCAADYTPVKDVLSSHLSDFGMDLRTLSNGANSEATIEKLQDRFSQEECADLTIFEIQALPQNHVKSYGEDCETNGEQIKTPIVVPCDDVYQGEASLEKLRDSSQLQDGLNLETFYGTAREPSYHVRSSTEDHHQIDPEEVMGPELVHLGNLITFGADREKQQSCPNPQEEYMDLDLFHGVKQPRQLVYSIGEESHNGEPDKIDDQIEAQEDPDPLSVSNAGTPSATVPSGLGVTTPKFMVIRTPAIRESARISRKRKCVFDDKTVLPNEVVKQSIHDASDLISKRRKVPQTALAAWRSCRIQSLPNDFLEPLLPADVSRELGSVLCKRKLKILQPAKTVRRPEKLHISKSPSFGRSEQIEIAPETPVLRSQSVRSFDSPKTPEGPHMDIRPEPSGRMEEELSPGRGQAGPSGVEQVPLLDWEQTGPSGSVGQVPLPESEQAGPSGTVEDVPFMDRHQEDDLNLLNEELEFCEGATPRMDGWSGRSRVVARYLHRRFPNGNGQGMEQVKLFQVSEGRTKKESARLFYEILVLKTKGYVDVKQDVAYGDLRISKLPKWDQTWGDDMVDNATSETLCAHVHRIRCPA